MEERRLTDDQARTDRVRAHSAETANVRIDEAIAASVRQYVGSEEAIARRLDTLEAEWDVERVLEANAATLGLAGVLLTVFVDRRWGWLPGIVSTFLFQHALQGWCPPVSVFRRLGIRTRREIDIEKYALKALRSDFEGIVGAPDPVIRAQKALTAVGMVG